MLLERETWAGRISSGGWRAGGGAREVGLPGTTIPGLDFAATARGYGVHATQAEDLAQLRALLAEPLDGPRLIQVDTAVTTPA
ncbi:MAG TPA: hypothetical protein VGH57_37800 [Amycolatopsis sp.]|jgi:thiamine pyrophosphate-dependent acetolactate synthase large subunit-like protein